MALPFAAYAVASEPLFRNPAVASAVLTACQRQADVSSAGNTRADALVDFARPSLAAFGLDPLRDGAVFAALGRVADALVTDLRSLYPS